MDEVYLGQDVYRVTGESYSAHRAYKTMAYGKWVYWYVTPIIIKGAKATMDSKDIILINPEPRFFEKWNYFKELEKSAQV